MVMIALGLLLNFVALVLLLLAIRGWYAMPPSIKRRLWIFRLFVCLLVLVPGFVLWTGKLIHLVWRNH